MGSIAKLSGRSDLLFVAAGKGAQSDSPQIRYLGNVPDERLMSVVYNCADLTVIPSREDNFPNTVGESLCCGTPVVGFARGGIPEMIEDGINGVLVGRLTSEALADGMHSRNTLRVGKRKDLVGCKAKVRERPDRGAAHGDLWGRPSQLRTSRMTFVAPLKSFLKAAFGRALPARVYAVPKSAFISKERFGSESCGWDVIANGLDRDSVVYSFGVGEDASFDLALIERFGLCVYAFDPTPRSILWVKKQRFPKQFRMQEYGISAFDGTALFAPPENSGSCVVFYRCRAFSKRSLCSSKKTYNNNVRIRP